MKSGAWRDGYVGDRISRLLKSTRDDAGNLQYFEVALGETMYYFVGTRPRWKTLSVGYSTKG